MDGEGAKDCPLHSMNYFLDCDRWEEEFPKVDAEQHLSTYRTELTRDAEE